MANPIKYNTSAETLALKKGNFYIGTGDVGKGPTSSTGYYNGVTPPSGGFTIYLNKASDGPAIYTASNEAQLTAITNTISVSTNLIKNNNGGNFADGTRAPFNYPYPAQTFPTVFDISNDKPYNGSSSKYALKFPGGVGCAIYSDPSPFTMTVGVVYTFSFWYKQNNSTQSSFNFNNQGGSGDMNGNFIASITTGPSQTWQRFSWTFTNVINKVYFIISPMTTGSEVLMTEFTLTEGSAPSGPGLTTSGQCLNWFASVPTDKMCVNMDYENIVTNGLVFTIDSLYTPSYPKNGTSIYDLSFSGNNGTLLNGINYSNDTFSLDGTNDYIQCSNITLPSENHSISIWFKTSSNGDQKIISFSNGCHPIQIINGRMRTCYGNCGVADVTTGVDGNWHMATVIVTNGVSRLYIDTSSTVIASITVSVGSPSQPGYPSGICRLGAVGAGPEGPTNPNMNFNGSIAICHMYNRSLTLSEVTQNYNAQKGRFGL
jgi:hypothetical protein